MTTNLTEHIAPIVLAHIGTDLGAGRSIAALELAAIDAALSRDELLELIALLASRLAVTLGLDVQRQASIPPEMLTGENLRSYVADRLAALDRHRPG